MWRAFACLGCSLSDGVRDCVRYQVLGVSKNHAGAGASSARPNASSVTKMSPARKSGAYLSMG